MSCWNWAILQIYFFTLNIKYTSNILLELFWFPKFVTLRNNLNTYVSSILWVHQECSNEVYFKYVLNLFLKCICISFLGEKYTWSRLSKLMYLFPNSKVYTWSRLSKLANLRSKLEAYLKYTFWIGVLFFKFRSIPEMDFLNLCIYIQTQKYTLSRFSK